MSHSDIGNTVICTFRVKPECEADFMPLLEAHWPTLVRLGLADESDPPQHMRGEEGGRPVLIEIFTWVNAEAPGIAHEHPEVAAIWEPMGALVEERDGKRQWEFPHYQRLTLGNA